MATYLEAWELGSNSDLRTKVAVACLLIAEDVRSGADTGAEYDETLRPKRRRWAVATIKDPMAAATTMLRLVVAKNIALNVAQMLAVSDAQILASVKNCVDLVADVEFQ